MLPPTMRFRRLKLLFIFSGVVLVLLLALMIFIWGPTPPGAPLPNPNGYDDFVAAGKAVQGDVSSYPVLNQNELRGLLSSNTEPFRVVQLGLTRDCMAPTGLLITNISPLTTDLPSLKRVSLLLAAQGRLAEMENRPADAAHSYIESIELGDRTSHGGLLINRLVGISCEAVGMNSLRKLTSSLNCAQSHSVVTELERIDRSRVTWDEVLRTEHRFTRAQLRQFSNFAPFVVGLWKNRTPIKHSEQRHYRSVTQLRLLSLELALHCYLSEQGRVPLNLEQLVPVYLTRVPLDPFSQRAFIFRPQGNNWLLYSVGPDGLDDGGKSITKGTGLSVPKGDILLNSPW